MFEYFYHEILRKTIVAFGTLFNSISIKKLDEQKNVISITEVPLAYGPTQKFLARLEQSPDLNKPIQITLPRMSFEITGLTYDSTRKLAPTQTFTTVLKSDTTDIRKSFMPVPYNMDFELSIMTQFNDDMLQIIEQILPYFQPAFTLTLDLVDSIGEKRDIPLTLDNISMEDNYEGDFTTRRALIYTLKFTAKTYLFGPVSGSDTSKDIIKKVSLGFISGDSGNGSTREVVYSAEPVATKNYTGNVTTLLSEDVSTDIVDILVNDSTNVPIKSYITLDEETLYVISKTNNSLKVRRGEYNTNISAHVLGTPVKKITTTDNNSIVAGDDFGFSGNI